MIPPERLVGYDALARGGPLGIVVDHALCGRAAGRDDILVRGGITRALYYHVPTRALRSVSLDRREIVVEVEVADFAARLREDGSVDLYLR